MIEWFIFLRGVALGVLLTLILGVLLCYRQHYSARMLALLALSVSGYVLAPLVYGKSFIAVLVVMMADTTPLMFLLFVQALFDDHSRPARASLGLGLLYLLSGYLASWFPALGAASGLEMSLLRLFSRAIMVAMLAYSLFLMLRNWRQDLVEQRRRLRVAGSLIAGTYILMVIVVETVFTGESVPVWLEAANSAGVAASSLLFVAVVIGLGSAGLLAPSQIIAPEEVAVAVIHPELARVLGAMEEERLYRNMALTIRALGTHLSIPEHQLRQHINQQLGYRNFADFLNHYRLEEVSRRLCDQDDRRLPVMTIAMDAGYRSMTTFNRAFKAAFGVPPTEYREQRLTNSKNS